MRKWRKAKCQLEGGQRWVGGEQNPVYVQSKNDPTQKKKIFIFIQLVRLRVYPEPLQLVARQMWMNLTHRTLVGGEHPGFKTGRERRHWHKGENQPYMAHRVRKAEMWRCRLEYCLRLQSSDNRLQQNFYFWYSINPGVCIQICLMPLL